MLLFLIYTEPKTPTIKTPQDQDDTQPGRIGVKLKQFVYKHYLSYTTTINSYQDEWCHCIKHRMLLFLTYTEPKTPNSGPTKTPQDHQDDNSPGVVLNSQVTSRETDS